MLATHIHATVRARLKVPEMSTLAAVYDALPPEVQALFVARKNWLKS
jgi:hypothetical protein